MATFPITTKCCSCLEMKPCRSVGCLKWRLPEPYRGKWWGCVKCHLPMDGAQVIICDDCYDAERSPVEACAGYTLDAERIKVSDLKEPFDHNPRYHPELAERN